MIRRLPQAPPVRRLTILYVTALVAIAATILFNHGILHSALGDQVYHDQVANLCRRQRALAEMLTKDAVAAQLAVETRERQQLSEDLDDTLRLWRRVQNGLQRGDPGLGLSGDNSMEVRNLLNVVRPHIDTVLTGTQLLVQRLTSSNEPLATDPMAQQAVQLILQAEPLYVRAQEDIIDQLEYEQAARTASLKVRLLFLLGLAIGMLLFQGIFVFRPATASIGRTFRRLEEATNELARSEATFRSTFEHSGVGVCLTSLDGTITQANPSFTVILKCPWEKLIGKRLINQIAADDRDLTSRFLRDFQVGHTRVPETEIRLQASTGQIVWVSVSAALVRSTDGQPLFSVWQFQNVSQRRQAIEALRESNQRVNRILESIAEAFIAYDSEWRYTYINDAAAQWMDHPREELIGKRLWDIYPGLVGSVLHTTFLEAAGRQTPIQFEEYFENSDAWLEIRAYPSREGMSVFLRDVTARHRAQEEIRRLNEALSRRSDELEAINAELEAFSYSVSHDLRAPLRSIAGFARALHEDYADSLDGTGRDYLDRVLKSSARMGQLIDDLLNLSRVTRAEIHLEPVDLAEMAREIAADLQGAAPERNIVFVAPKSAMAVGDPRLLRIALENLLSNAFKFTSLCSNARVEFGVEAVSGTTAYFVRDNGAGFDMTYASKLFGAFQRLHSPNEFPGTGIGLATVQRIILRHGGRCWATGETGIGASFYFTVAEATLQSTSHHEAA